MSRPFFSVIIPTYNRGDKLPETIGSLLYQELEDWELVIVDDGSTDDTAQIVANYTDPRIKFVQTENRERAAARNSGVSNSTGRYLTFLDSDDIIYPNHLKSAYTFLVAHPDVHFFRQPYEVKDVKSNKILSQSLVEGNLNEALIFGNFLSCLGVFVLKDVLLKYRFNEDRNLSGCEDYELWLRLASRYTLHGSREITAALLQHGNRSVLFEPRERLVTRVNLLYHYLLEDDTFLKKYGRFKRSFRANNLTYISLHLAISKMRWSSFTYLIRAFFKYPLIAFRRRTYAILKLILT